MKTVQVFAIAFVFAGALLVGAIVVWTIHGPEVLQSALIIGFTTIMTPLGAFVLRVLQSSPVGTLPVQNSLSATQHFVEHPESLPSEVQEAVIKKNGHE